MKTKIMLSALFVSTLGAYASASEYYNCDYLAKRALFVQENDWMMGARMNDKDVEQMEKDIEEKVKVLKTTKVKVQDDYSDVTQDIAVQGSSLKGVIRVKVTVGRHGGCSVDRIQLEPKAE